MNRQIPDHLYSFFVPSSLAACRTKGETKDATETKSKEVRAWSRVSLFKKPKVNFES